MDAPLPGINEPETIANTITDDATGRPFLHSDHSVNIDFHNDTLDKRLQFTRNPVCLIIFMTVKTDVSHLKVLI